jgi:5-methylcytosine-specific restriction endonuclease McrA
MDANAEIVEISKIKINLCRVCGEHEAIFCRDCHGLSHKIRRQKFKKSLFKLKGKVCEHCGATELSTLTVHHLYGKDNESQYDPEKCQILCMNCHWGKIHKQKADD